MANGLPQRSDWNGLIQNRVDTSDGPSLAVVVGPAGPSWSSPVRVTGDDRLDYFAKFPELCRSQQDQMSVVTEMVVGKAGVLIGAPVCRTVVMAVPNELQGEQLKPGVSRVQVFLARPHRRKGCDGIAGRQNHRC